VIRPLFVRPPLSNETDSSSPLLWEVSASFRHSVELALDGDRDRDSSVRVAPSFKASNNDDDNSEDKDNDSPYFSDKSQRILTRRQSYPMHPILVNQEE
jgi:hypothetical protein